MDSQHVRILIVDDHLMVRMGLANLLEDEPGFTVVGQGRNGAEALRLYNELAPDILVIDANLPDMHGVEVAQAVLATHPDARLVMVSISESSADVQRALDAGIAAYVPKSCDREAMIEAVRTVMAGNRYLPAALAVRIALERNQVALSHRELEVLRLIGLGMANKQIADSLGVTTNTVKTHVAHIMEKLGAPDRTRAVTVALSRGLLRL